MAQKRNPISLRLQTRLQGHEKRFTSCWFTDFFFPQAYTNDLTNRLYLGHLFEKGGGWCAEKSESDLPETCVSIQFLYRRSLIFSILLDKRKQEYILSASSKSINIPREHISGPSQQRGKDTQAKTEGLQGALLLRAGNQRQVVSEISINTGGKHTFLSPGDITKKQPRLQTSCKPLVCTATKPAKLFGDLDKDLFNSALLSPGMERDDIINKTSYLLISNFFGHVVARNARAYETLCAQRFARTDLHKVTMSKLSGKDIYSIETGRENNLVNNSISLKEKNGFTYQKEWGGLQNKVLHERRVTEGWLHQVISSQYHVIPDLPPVSTIEAICHISSQSESLKKSKKSNAQYLDSNGDIFKGALSINPKENKTAAPLTLATHWSSCTFMKTTSAFQNVEFCLYSVAFLYKKRLPFSSIKSTVFKMLSDSQIVQGARLVCSGRQGGRSKSAMRAKKQSAVWGQTALSLFSSRLAFASTNVDTSFGQVGIKIWICYK